MTGGLARMGALIARFPWPVLLCWIALTLLAIPLSRELGSRLERSGGPIPGSESGAVQVLLGGSFTNPFVDAQIVAVRSERLTLGDPAFRGAIAAMARDLRAEPGVTRVAAATDPDADARLRAPDGHSALILVGENGGAGKAADAVHRVRRVIAPHMAALRRLDPGLEGGTTGHSAFVTDVIGRNATDSAAAEKLVTIPALLLLLLVFGSPLAALLPVLLGLAATLLTLGSATLAAPYFSLNAYVQTAGTMLGLALGIDYALIVVSRFREERAAGRPPDLAVVETLRTAGWTVVCSGAVVLVALGALVPSGLTEMISVGVGGALTVFWAVLLATTLLPALLVIFGSWLDRPRRWTGRFSPVSGEGTRRMWARWADAVTRWRWPAAAVTTVFLLLLAWPLTRYQTGLPDGRWFPADLEAARGGEVLAGMQQTGLGFPLHVVVRANDGSDMLSAAGVRAMWRVSRDMRRDTRVAEVIGPVDLKPGMGLLPALLFYARPDSTIKNHPMIQTMFLSRDRKAALMQVVLRHDVPLSQSKAFVQAFRARQEPGYQAMIGGTAAQELDLEQRQAAYAPWALAFIFVATGLLLGFAFRSVLIPLKAIALNMLAVCAATGLIVLVFQEGHGRHLVGLAEPLGSVPLTLPMLIFCLTFGLSMDYEVLMLSRVRDERGGEGGDRGAIARGLGASAGVITAAAAIMALVFGAFVAVDMALVKMLGFGLAVAILLDATVVRGVLAPAVLAIAGRWNWWPGERPPR